MVESLRKQQEKVHGLLKTIEDMDGDIERAKKVRKNYRFFFLFCLQWFQNIFNLIIPPHPKKQKKK